MKLLFLTILLSSILNCQSKKDIYLELNPEKISYTKNVFKRSVDIDTAREYSGYGFIIRCECHPNGSLSFSGHDNPDVGELFEPIRTINNSVYKQLKFTDFDVLIALLKQHDLKFNEKYNLYIVEPDEEGLYKVYHVYFRNTFWEH